MFNDDEVRSALTKMYNYSPVDGFVEISQGLGDMMTSLANEPSLGLFYVQEHTHNAIPNIVNFRDKIVAKSREIGLHTEDSEESIAMVRSMADCGFPIVDGMIKDVAKCLAIMSSKQPRRGLICSRSVSWFKTGPTSWKGHVNDFEKLETVNCSDTMQNAGDELPVSSLGNADDVLVDNLMSNVSALEDFNGFKDGKEARLEKWLEEMLKVVQIEQPREKKVYNLILYAGLWTLWNNMNEWSFSSKRNRADLQVDLALPDQAIN